LLSRRLSPAPATFSSPLPVKDGTTGELATGGGAVKPFAIKGANTKVDFVVP
jgi:hypothetical protein